MSKDTKSPSTDLVSGTENFSNILFNLFPVWKKPIELSFTAEGVREPIGVSLHFL